jgi:DNA helicase-2/ATP-dependent DNA helicase PcrA
MSQISALEIFEALAKKNEKLNKPTDEQIEIIQAPLAPAVVVAGAGSGKTETMSARVLYLVANKMIDPEKLLGLTFTRKAAGELLLRVRMRLRQLQESGIVKDLKTLHEPTILTYHSYAGRIVTEYGLRKGIEPDLIPLGEAATWQLASEVVSHYTEMPEGIDASANSVTEDLISLSRLMAEHGSSVDDIRAITEELVEHLSSLSGKPTQDNLKIINLAKLRLAELPLVTRFEELRRERNLLTFDDQMSIAADLAQRYDDVAELERSKFHAVLLDEYQDTSQSQLRLLSALFGKGHPVMAVGDPFQSIYGWRGASADTIDTFFSYFPAREKSKEARYSLSISWRNDHSILDLANSTIDLINLHRGSAHEVKRLRARDDASKGQLLAGIYQTYLDEAEAIADYFQPRVNEKTSCAVLVRSRSQVDRIERALRERAIPVEVVGIGGLLYVPEVVEVISLLKSIAFTDRGASLARLLAGDRYAIGVKDLAALGRYSRDLILKRNAGVKNSLVRSITEQDSEIAENDGQFDGNIVEALDEIDEAPPHLFSKEGLARLRQASRDISRVRARSGSLIDMIMEAMRVLGLEAEVMVRDGIKNGPRHLHRFLDEASKYQNQGGTLIPFLDWIDQAKKSERGLKESEVKVSKGIVQIITIHGAKGLEWDHVAVPGIRDRNFPVRGKGLENWLTDAGHLPFPLRGDAGQLPSFNYMILDDHKGLTNARKVFADHCRDRRFLEELRLGYVAFTRAKNSLFASSAFFHDGKEPESPSALFELLMPIAEFVTEKDQHEPTGVNPLLANPPSYTWPFDPWGERRSDFDSAVSLVTGAKKLDDEALATLDREVFLLIESERNRRGIRRVLMPERISVSLLDLICQDPLQAAMNFRRPIPTHTNRFARKGTEFHSWVEERLVAKRKGIAHNEGSEVDSENLAHDDLESLERAWLSSDWASREAFEIELPFEIIIEGTLLRGRMDAVYRSENSGDDRYEIIDWKTGKEKSGEDLKNAAVQLAAYRIAFSRIYKVDPEQISAAFHYVAENKTVTPERLLSEAEIIQSLPRWGDGR